MVGHKLSSRGGAKREEKTKDNPRKTSKQANKRTPRELKEGGE
jgi:hypothetical protein